MLICSLPHGQQSTKINLNSVQFGSRAADSFDGGDSQTVH